MLPQSQQICNAFWRCFDTGHLTQVLYAATIRTASPSDGLLHSPPGPKAPVAHAPVLRQPDTEASIALTPSVDEHQKHLLTFVIQGTPARTSGHTTGPTTPLPAQAVTLVQQFYRRFHGLLGVTPTAKELAQATTLLTQHGAVRAHFLLTYAREAALATDYHPQTFMGILHYLPRALAAYALHTARARARQAEAAERVQHERYAQWRQQALAELRAALPAAELAALEAAQQARLVAAGTAPVALRLAVRLAVDAMLEAQAGLPDFDTWRQA